MLTQLARLTLGALFVAFFCGSGSAQTGPTLFGEGTQLVYHSHLKLESQQKQGLSWLRNDQQYFGAMAILPGTGIWASFRGFHSWDVAIQSALFECGLEALSEGQDPKECVLYASVLPRSLDAKAAASGGSGKLPSGLGQNAYSIFVGEYQSKQIPDTYGAFAISGLAQDAYSVGFSSEAAARDRAIAECEAFVAKVLVPYPKSIRDLMRENDLDRCWVVHVHRP